MTEEDSWKVSGSATLLASPWRYATPAASPKSDSIEAVGRVLDKSEAPAVVRAVTKRYGILGWGFGVYMKLRGLDRKSVGVELKAA